MFSHKLVCYQLSRLLRHLVGSVTLEMTPIVVMHSKSSFTLGKNGTAIHHGTVKANGVPKQMV